MATNNMFGVIMMAKHLTTQAQMLIRATFAFLAALFLPLSAEAAETTTLQLGGKFSSEMESNPTTGFEWRLARPLDEKIIKLADKTFIPRDNPGPRPVAGAGGKEIWTFEAVGRGTTEISLEYVRSWETGIPPNRTMTYQVEVK